MTFLYLLDLLGTAAFAASGAFAGVRRGMDVFGVLMLGLVTATGGGTLRDLLLGDTPPFIFKNETYLYISIAVSLAVFMLHHKLDYLEHPLQFFDAIGLGTFVVIGTGKALAFHFGMVGAVMMGVMTATAGGMIRDILSNQVPMVLQKEVYASACMVGGFLLVLMHRANLPNSLSVFVAAIVVIAVRLLAIRYRWSLPKAQQI
jgi:uncharacterized membrane protein YeiH